MATEKQIKISSQNDLFDYVCRMRSGTFFVETPCEAVWTAPLDLDN